MKHLKIASIALIALNIQAPQAKAAYGLEGTQILHFGQTLIGWIRNYTQLADSYIRAGEQLTQQAQISSVLGVVGNLRDVGALTNQITEAVTHMPSTIGTDIINLGMDTLDTYNHVVSTFSRGEHLYDELTGKEKNQFGPGKPFLSGQDLNYRMSNMRSNMSSDFLNKSKNRGEQFQKWETQQTQEHRDIITSAGNSIALQKEQAKIQAGAKEVAIQAVKLQTRAEERAALEQLSAEAEKQHQIEINNVKYGKSMVDVINSLPR